MAGRRKRGAYTERFLSSLMALISIFLRPIVAVRYLCLLSQRVRDARAPSNLATAATRDSYGRRRGRGTEAIGDAASTGLAVLERGGRSMDDDRLGAPGAMGGGLSEGQRVN